MAALIAGNRDSLDILLYGGIHHLFHRTVVPQVNHFDPGPLQDTAKDVDRGIMPVEKRRGGDDPDIVYRLINLDSSTHGPSLECSSGRTAIRRCALNVGLDQFAFLIIATCGRSRLNEASQQADDEIGLQGGVVLNAVVPGQEPASKGPHVS